MKTTARTVTSLALYPRRTAPERRSRRRTIVRKFPLIWAFLALASLSANAQMSQMKSGQTMQEDAYAQMRVFRDDEIVACWELENIENFLMSVSEKNQKGESISWSDLLVNHKCALVGGGAVITLVGISKEGEPLEGKFEAHPLEFGDVTYTVIKVIIEPDEDEATEYYIGNSGEMRQISASGDMWVIGEFLDDATIEM